MTTFQKYILIAFFIALINAVFLLVFFVPSFDHSDTAQYISTIEYISGEPNSELFLRRILSPMPVLIGSVISPIVGVENTLIVQGLFFYLLSAWLIFILIYRLYKNEKQALYGTVLFVGAYPMLAFGLASLTDTAGWFFYLLSVLLALDFLKNPQMKKALFAGFVAGFGLMFKESVATAPIFFTSLVLIAGQFPFKDKVKYIFLFGLAFLVGPIINSIVLYSLFGYSYYHAYRIGGLSPEGSSGFYMVSWARIIFEIGRVLLIGWIFFLMGGIKEFFAKNKDRTKILLAFVVPSLSFFLWSYPHNRMMYIAAPFLMFLASFGVLRNYKNPKLNIVVEVSLISAYLITGYLLLEFFLNYGPMFQQYLEYD